jgi:membrane-associated phospholipid phosphatase
MTDAVLVPRRPLALALVAVGVLVTAGLGVHYANTSHPGRIDVAIDRRLQHHSSGQQATLVRIITVADPRNVLLACVAIGALFLWCERRRLALLSLLGPLAAVALTDVVLKPLINRRYLGALSFPSGHTTATVAIVTVVVIGMTGANQPRWPLTVRLLIVAVAVATALTVAIALVAARYHYATDTMGGAALAIATVMTGALAIDETADRNDRRRLHRVRSDLPRHRRTR